MRAILIAALTAAGIGLIGTSGAVAAPASGSVIDAAATANQLTQQAWHRGYRHRHWRRCVHWRYHSRVRCWRRW